MISLTSWLYGKERTARSPVVTLEPLPLYATPDPWTPGNVAVRFCGGPFETLRRYDLSLSVTEARELAAALTRGADNVEANAARIAQNEAHPTDSNGAPHPR